MSRAFWAYLALYLTCFVAFAMTWPSVWQAIVGWLMSLFAYNLGARVEAAVHPRSADRAFRREKW